MFTFVLWRTVCSCVTSPQLPTIQVLEMIISQSGEKQKMLFLLAYFIYLEWAELVLSA